MKEAYNMQVLFIRDILTILTYYFGVHAYSVMSRWLSIKVFLQIHHLFLILWCLLLCLHQRASKELYSFDN
ncbi:hypothetical protein XELAEV_18039923mg [Xenopus laevis]|uniref:Uncharacterized protein n=1 Tax=Xenopus laevis TaxID=8355 RepID=A0A974C968_XENLA|nr:hypothetical protein XELAEV_18039923mg [Xenopus laevis]